MVLIPGGTFVMGSPDGESLERPNPKVTLSPYFIDRYETSVDRFAACVNSGKCQKPNAVADWPGLSLQESEELTHRFCNWGKPGRGNHPMNCVNWDMASAFCQANGKRLPTEAEWEFAARGTDGRLFPWGNQSPETFPQPPLQWGRNDGTAPVDSHPEGASPFGNLNMAGNVWEWVADWKGPYPGGSVKDPQGPANGDQRICRGDGFGAQTRPIMARATTRNASPSGLKRINLGFRCARSALQ